MLFKIDEGTEKELEVIFPYDKIYPEQYSYVCDLKRSLDANVSRNSPSISTSTKLTGCVHRVTAFLRCPRVRARLCLCCR